MKRMNRSPRRRSLWRWASALWRRLRPQLPAKKVARTLQLASGAAAAYLLLTKKDKVPGLIAGAGAAYAYKKYDDSKRDRQNRDRYYYDRYDRYDSRYDRNRDLYHDRSNDAITEATDMTTGTTIPKSVRFAI